jgi:hypothetical protein
MLLLLLRFKSIAFFDHIEVSYAPIVGEMDLFAPADNVRRRKNRVFDYWL